MKLYVGNLPWSIDDNKLRELFASYGDITEATVIKNKFSNRSKGFGFVTFANEEDAKKALSEMAEKQIEGRPLTVSEARPMTPRDDAPKKYESHNDSAEAPIADSSQINGQVEQQTDLEIADDKSDAEADKEDIDNIEEAKEDAESDEPATENASKSEETTEEN